MLHLAQTILPYALILISTPLIWRSMKALNEKDELENEFQTLFHDMRLHEAESYDVAIRQQKSRFWLYGVSATSLFLGGVSLLLF